MGKKNKKEKKGAGAAKTAVKTEKKASQRLKKEMRAKGEEDIEQLIAEIQEQDRKNELVTEESVPPPSPRSSFTFTTHPDKEELLLFGGEYFNGSHTVLYNDLYIYQIKKKEWILLKAPGAPPPRCAHQTCALSQGGGQLWIFGGEFTSSTQSQFHHYKDLWVFHLQHKRWEKISATGGPSARSGHRMVAAKKQLIVFGGFHDNGRDYKYFNDVYAFNLETYKWSKLEGKGLAPSPRSGCQMAAISGERILIYGGYSKDRLKKDVDRGIVHSDIFLFQPEKDDVTGTKWHWSQVKQSGSRPSPRCGCTMTVVPNGSRAYIFGGVYDEESEEALEGTFYNDCYQLDVENKKWHLVRLSGGKTDDEKTRRRRANREKTAGENVEGNAVSEHVEHLKLDEAMDSSEPSEASTFDDGVFTVKIGPQNEVGDPNSDDDDDTDCGREAGREFVPRPRMNAGLIIKHGTLYLYGGTYEVGDKSVTLADLYALDFHKMDRWQTIVEFDDKEQQWMDLESSDDEDGNVGEQEENESGSESDEDDGSDEPTSQEDKSMETN